MTKIAVGASRGDREVCISSGEEESECRRHTARKLAQGRSCWGLECRSMSPPHFPTIHNPLTASPSFHVSDLALALKHFRQACLIESSNTMGLPGEPQPQKPLLSGRTTSASFPFLPNKRSRGSQRALGMQHCENTHDLRTLPQPQKEKQGAKSYHLPTSPGRKAFTSQHCHLYKPPLCFQQVSKGICALSSDRNAQGES